MQLATLAEQDKDKRAVAVRLQAGARRVHRPRAAGGDAGRRRRRQGRLPDPGGEVQGLPGEGPALRQQSQTRCARRSTPSPPRPRGCKEEYAKIWDYKDATWTLASFLRSGDIFYEFAQKLIKAADSPPDELKRLSKKACKAGPEPVRRGRGEYKDAIFQFVTPVEDEAKKQWKATLERAADLGVTNDYVKKARENLSKYLPDEFPFIKDERIGMEYP